MGIGCSRREEMASMEGVDTMMMIDWLYIIITGISITALIVGVVYGLYMAIWGVYDEYQ